MAKVHQRIFAIVGALLFFISSIALTVAVFWQIHQTNQAEKAQKAKDTSQTNQTTPQEGKLQGTKLEGFTPVTKVDQLQKIDMTTGSGDTVKAGDTVTVHYTGAVAATGVIFQSSHDMGQPISFGLNQVIKGWTDGVPGMQAGGKRRLLIPADQAYGANPPSGSGIPANADLVFDIELVKVGQ